ncbi:ATP-binding cassette domain-containing protein [Sphingomonas prati]|uniref:Molybdate transport system ATP-binding protein n=1 Tax=Sphingomonas prati TaxID=1843237 RepID=A0A7W9F456_9SPHN|nr:ATP-binding cassette domain-containing protein [Sphingomonas prati]MBB5730160.1 molybdate transport system ATP-binding protein [Sphingomonas prati]GGE91958.1 hypothetical protein GCM10011404_26100 [Sphingomonas prati]
MSFDIALRRRLGARDIALTFKADDGLTVLFGPSGAGKTSVLNMVAGLLTPDAGHVRVGGATLFDAAARVDVAPERRRIGYVFQDGRLFPHLRVRANLLYGWRLAAEADRWIGLDEVVAFLGLGELLDRWPRSLSGGEAQRVAIGRALLSGARTLLMDEPLASLDASRRGEIIAVIERVRDDLKLPILYVTHDPAEAERLGTQLVAMG